MGEIASLLPIIQGGSQFASSMEQGSYARQVGNMNAKYALAQGEDAKRIGEVEASRREEQGAQDVSAHRAATAAGNVNVNTGSAAKVQAAIKQAADIDAATIRKNAAMASWGYGVDAANSRAKGRMAGISAQNEGIQSLISGGMQFAKKYGEYGVTSKDAEFNYGDQEELKKTKAGWEDLD